MFAGRPLAWCILRTETTDGFKRILGGLKQACEQRMKAQAALRDAGQPAPPAPKTAPDGQIGIWQPSCVLVDNDDKEINAAR